MRRLQRSGLTSLILLAGAASVARAQTTPDPTAPAAEEPLEILEGKSDIAEISLTDLLNQEIDVAAKTPLTLRDSPGVITVVTREEILASGARNLVDVLQLVPGFAGESDVEGSTSVVFRGLNATDGRILILVDGQIYNELLYSFPQLGDRFPIEQIERVEIIRGPGSAIYGGFAELAVINIVTRSATAVSTTLGQFDGPYARQTLSLSVLQKAKDAEVSLAVYFGRTHRSNHVYTDYYGEQFKMTGGAQEQPRFVNLGARWRDLKIRMIFDDYREKVRDNYDASTPEPYMVSYRSYYASAAYDLKLSHQLTVTPRLAYMWQRPWYMSETPPDGQLDASGVNPFYEKSAQRVISTLSASYDLLDCAEKGSCSDSVTKLAKRLNLLGGVEYYIDRGKTLDLQAAADGIGYQSPLECSEPDPLMCDPTVTHGNTAVFAQVLDESVAGIVTLGARFEHNSVYGNSFVPRAAYTKVLGPAHVKALASSSFRAPSYENISLAFPGDEVTPERTRSFEIEAGYQITPNAIVTGNVFDTKVKNPIIYQYDPVTAEEGYANQPNTGSRGAELEARVRTKRFWATGSYSVYSTVDNGVETFSVPGKPTVLLGIPKHKFTLLSSIEVIKNLRVNPQLIWMSGKYYYSDYDVVSKGDDELLASLFFAYHSLGFENLDVSAGVHNILDTEWWLVQPYNGFHPRVPGPSREYLLRVSWEM